jgi:coenzyme PQQ precursor peptide PqqA
VLVRIGNPAEFLSAPGLAPSKSLPTAPFVAARSPPREAHSLDAGGVALHIVFGTQDRIWRFGILVSRRITMKLEWHKPEAPEQEVGLEVTSYAPAELDRS